MSKFLYQICKNETEEQIELIEYYVNDKKETICNKTRFPYSILINKKDFETLNIKSDNVFLAEQKLKDINGEEVIKIEIKSKELYKFILSELKEIKSMPYEQDLITEHKLLIENNLPLIEGSEYLPLKYLSIDIETLGEGEKQNIIMISSYSPNDENVNKVYCDMSKITKDNVKAIEKYKFEGFELVKCASEKEVLSKFQEDIIIFEPQTIIGWNVIDFDFKIIKDRLKAFGLKFKFSKSTQNCKLNLRSDFFQDSFMECPGTLIFDIIHLLKKNFIVFEDYKLNTVAKAVLSDTKVELGDDSDENEVEDKLLAIENLFKKDPIKLIEYNFKDSYLTSAIVEKLNLLELMCKRSILTGTPISRVKSPIATLDVMYLKELHKKNLVANTNFNFQNTNPIEGAYVIEPKRGFYEDVFVLDFKSLYPSIIMTFNIDPFTYCKSGQIESPTSAKFDKTPGILPELILKLYKERNKAKKDNDEIKSFALKTTMNSFYGALASPKSRYYNQDVGEAITGFARHIIKKAKSFVEELGHKVIYGDTDSIFVKFNAEFKDKESKIVKGKELEKIMNTYFNNWVKTEYGQKNFLDLEFEKLYSKFFIATKKRYVGYDEFTKKIQFIGMEAIRGDWTMLARNFQVELVNLIFEKKPNEEIEKYIKNYIKKLRDKDFDDLLIYTKKIAKPLSEYTKITPPHVKAAREVKDFKGRVVKYYILKSGPKHISLKTEKDEFDYDHYIKKQLKGVSDDLLECLGIDFDKTIGEIKQKSLDSFF